MDEGLQADAVSHASLNGIYVKAQELDRGHNVCDAPAFAPPGNVAADESAHASDASTHASTHASDVSTHASTHASDADAPAHASQADGQARASER